MQAVHIEKLQDHDPLSMFLLVVLCYSVAAAEMLWS